VIHLASGIVPVDAKFPLENFKRLIAESTDEKTVRRSFSRDVKQHIDAIASKYIRTDEGTFDFALMYIPAENVYYEVIIREEGADAESGLLGYALKKKVIPVSPASFYAYLQTVLLGLKGMQVEKSARDILNNLSRLRRDFAAFEEDFRKVGGHLENSSKKFADAEKRLGKVDDRMQSLEGMAASGEATEPLRLEESA
jgi:DNA recombination protein RmuC